MASSRKLLSLPPDSPAGQRLRSLVVCLSTRSGLLRLTSLIPGSKEKTRIGRVLKRFRETVDSGEKRRTPVLYQGTASAVPDRAQRNGL